MTAPGPRRPSMSSGLLEKLIAVVRPEFRVEVYLVDPDDPVLGRRRCAVAKCDRPVSGNGLCSGHGQRGATVTGRRSRCSSPTPVLC